MSRSNFTTTTDSASFYYSTSSTTTTTTTPSSAAKRPKNHHHQNIQKQEQEQADLAEANENQSLLPGLPDHIAQLCLSKVPPSVLYFVSRPWRRLIYSPSFPPFMSIYAVLVSCQKTPDHQSYHSIKFSCFDPIASKWLSLTSPLSDPHLRLLLRHPSFISRRLPIQSVSVSGQLVLLAATADQFRPALKRPLVFNPLTRSWTSGPPVEAPRRWCAAGASAGVVYIASGVGSHYNLEVARSVEKWDLQINHNKSQTASWRWEKMGGLSDGRFSRDAIDAVGWRGKLCMVNVKGDAAKEGIIYDVKNDAWEDMPEGMRAGWRGPAAAMDEETIYVVNESTGVLKMYDPVKDVWVQILENKMFQGAQYVAAVGGRVCIVGDCGVGIAVVDVAVAPPKLWVVDTPPEYQAVAIHVLPRISH